MSSRELPPKGIISALIRFRVIDMVDNDKLHRSANWLQFQAELFLDRGEDRR